MQAKFSFFLWLSIFPCFSMAQKASIERVEPAFWWTEMKNLDVQLLIYGKNISQYTMSLNYSGVTVMDVQKVESPNYLFVTLHISLEAKPGKFPLVFKNGRKAFNYI